MTSSSSPPLRVTFESGAQLLEGLRYQEGLASFLWSPSGDLPPGAEIGNEVCVLLEFEDTGRRFHVSTRVLSRAAAGESRGIRFEFMRDQPLRQEIVLMSARGESIPYRRRKRERVERTLDAKLMVGSETLAATLADVSPTGALVEVDDELELDSTVHVDVQIFDARVRVAARLSWSAPRGGRHAHGLEFLFESAEQRDQVARAVAQLVD